MKEFKELFIVIIPFLLILLGMHIVIIPIAFWTDRNVDYYASYFKGE